MVEEYENEVPNVQKEIIELTLYCLHEARVDDAETTQRYVDAVSELMRVYAMLQVNKVEVE